jgi:hypothetical protein
MRDRDAPKTTRIAQLDAQRQGQHGDGAHYRRRAQRPERVAKIVHGFSTRQQVIAQFRRSIAETRFTFMSLGAGDGCQRLDACTRGRLAG